MRAALKEWAVVVDALGRGEQILLLRNGGVAEDRAGFELRHDRFLLFPSMFHQQRESVVPDAQRRFDDLAPSFAEPAILRLDYFAQIEFSVIIPTLDEARRLKGTHIWSEDAISKRFDWGTNRGILLLVVRVFRLAGQVELPMVLSYRGCKSWVGLESEVVTNGSAPVLSDGRFAQKLEQIRNRLRRTEEQAAVSGRVV